MQRDEEEASEVTERGSTIESLVIARGRGYL